MSENLVLVPSFLKKYIAQGLSFSVFKKDLTLHIVLMGDVFGVI